MAILVVGSFTVDYTVQTPRFPASGETVIGNTVKTSLGGKGANQAMAAKRLGSDVAMVGMVGRDDHGDKVLAAFDKAGVDISRVKRSAQPTGFASITIDKSGENRIVMVPGANCDYPAETLRTLEDCFAQSSVVMTQLEMTADVVAVLAEQCEIHNKPFILNPAPMMRRLSKDVLKRVNYLIPNETELAMLVDRKPLSSDEDILAAGGQLLEDGVDHVIVTLGARGAMLVDKHGSLRFDGFSVHAVDTVAAGDAFNGAFAHKIDTGASIEESIRYANAAGALTVQKHGAINALPDRESVEAFLRTRTR